MQEKNQTFGQLHGLIPGTKSKLKNLVPSGRYLIDIGTNILFTSLFTPYCVNNPSPPKSHNVKNLEILQWILVLEVSMEYGL